MQKKISLTHSNIGQVLAKLAHLFLSSFFFFSVQPCQEGDEEGEEAPLRSSSDVEGETASYKDGKK